MLSKVLKPLAFIGGVHASTDSCGLLSKSERLAQLVPPMVDKIAEQSLLETMEETELEFMNKMKERYGDKINHGLKDIQKLEVKERQAQIHKVREIQDRIEASKVEHDLQDRVCSMFFARHHFYNMVHTTIGLMQVEGTLSAVGDEGSITKLID